MDVVSEYVLYTIHRFVLCPVIMETVTMTPRHRYIAEIHHDLGADGTIQLLSISLHTNVDMVGDQLVTIPPDEEDDVDDISERALYVHHFMRNHPDAIVDVMIDIDIKNQKVDIYIVDAFDVTVPLRDWYTILQGIIGKKNMPTYRNTFFQITLQDTSSITYNRFGRVSTVKVPTLQTILKRTTENNPMVFDLFHPRPKQIRHSLSRSLKRAVVKRGLTRANLDTLQRNPRGAVLNPDLIRTIGEFTAGARRRTRRRRR